MPEVHDEIVAVTMRMLNAMHERDVAAYRECCADDVSAFEWYIAPYRVDTIDFHLTLIEAGGNGAPTRLDLLTPRVQAYGDTAIITYTLLKTFAEPGIPASFKTTNETRVFAKVDGAWKMVHLHKSPANS
jgi:ketosteroid isomerase-like protein